jgi:hypothetical protein
VRAKRSDLKAWGFSLTPAAKRKGGKKPPTLPQGGALNQVLFTRLCKAHGLPVPDYEVEFCPGRKFRFDVLWGRCALEVQGAIFSGGRHVHGAALLSEYEKLNLAVCLGFSVLFCTPAQIDNGSIFPVVKRALGSEAGRP